MVRGCHAAMEMEFKYRIWGTLAYVVFFFPVPPCSVVYIEEKKSEL